MDEKAFKAGIGVPALTARIQASSNGILLEIKTLHMSSAERTEEAQRRTLKKKLLQAFLCETSVISVVKALQSFSHQFSQSQMLTE